MSKIIIHGGCGQRESAESTFKDYHEHLLIIIKKSYQNLLKEDNALNAALYAAKLLEDDPIFNAGLGSRVQQDGQIRMSASIMDGEKERFAGVMNIQNIRYPSKVAYALLSEKNTVLAGDEATSYAQKKLGMEKCSLMTESRYREYLQLKTGRTGTVGVVVMDSQKNIVALTSTGGAGFEMPGRVSDSATVAGNYASSVMGISCTGIGEHIVNAAVAAKVHTRVKDGASLQKSIELSINESNQKGDYVGLIALDQHGNILSGSTKVAQTLYAYHDGDNVHSFYDKLKS